MELWDKAERLWTRVKNWKTVRGWHIWKLKLVDARLYFVSMFVGLLTGLVAVPYHYLLYYLFHLRSGFFASHPAWYWHIPLFLFSWGILVFVMWLVGKMPLIGGGGIPQTRGVINGRITYRHPFIEMVSKFVGGILSFSAGLSLGREGPSVQIGSYVGSLVSRWTHILKGEQKQLLAAGAGAGLAAAFAAPLASSLIVIESIERFDAPKTAITTLLAGVVAGAVASMVFPVNPYHLIEVTEPVFAFFVQMKYFLILAVIVSVCGKFYSSTMNAFRHVYAKVNSPAYVKMFYLVLVAYIVSLVVCWARALQLYIMAAFSPIPLSLMALDDTRQIGVGYIKNFAAVCIAGLVILILLVSFPLILGGLVAVNPGTGTPMDSIANGLTYALQYLAMCVLLILSLVKSGTWARDIVSGF